MIPFRSRSLRSLLLGVTILSGATIFISPGSAVAQVEVVISANVAPPALLVYAQPPMPELGYVWTPGYWQWVAPTGYYWVPGTWVLPPEVDVLWTPPYWGWADGLYVFHGGYWGPHVGFYGGVDYGYGYGGSGYEGGRWEGGHFAYNSAVNNFGSVHVANSYRQNLQAHNNSHVSFNGGPGGIRAEPSAGERSFQAEPHQAATADQNRHMSAAAVHPGLVATQNHGRPQIAATARPGEFTGRGVVPPRQAESRPMQNHAAVRPAQQQPAAARPQQQHAAARPQQQHAAPRPQQQHAGAQPQQQHAAARPQQDHAAEPHPEQHNEARR